MSSLSPKEIGRLAGRAFQSIIPARWITRSQEDQEDYGIDYEIELVTADDKATGFIFKVQQKGVENAVVLADGKTISYSDLPTERVAYYLRKVRIPIVLVVVDVTTKRSYWLHLQGNREVEQRLADAEANGHKSLTVHIPMEDVLPETAERMLARVREMLTFLMLEMLKATTVVDVQGVIATEPDLSEVESSLRFAQAVVRSEKTQRLINQQRLDEALRMNEKAYADDGEPFESRFTAGMEIVRLATGIHVTQPQSLSKEQLLSLRFDVFHDLVKITRSLTASHPLRHYAVFLARISRLRVVVYNDQGLFLGRQIQNADPDPFAELAVAGAQQQTIIRLSRELRAAQHRIMVMLSHGWLGLVVYACAELTETVGAFLLRLKQDGLDQGAEAIRVWLDQVSDVCMQLAPTLLDDNSIALLALNHVRIGLVTESIEARVEQARTLMGSIKAEAVRKHALTNLDRMAELSAAPTSDPDADLPAEDVEPVVRQMARAMGIDVDDPNDELAYIVRVGIRDYNPERVLRDCTHLFTEIHSYGIPAQMLGLPSAGSKIVRCTKHGHGVGGLELDRIYSHFKREYCDSCPDRAARPEEWRWSSKWHEAEAKRIARDPRPEKGPNQKRRRS